MNKKELLEITKQFVSSVEICDDNSLNAAFVLKKSEYEKEKQEIFQHFNSLKEELSHKLISLYKSNNADEFEARIEKFMKAALSEKATVFEKEEKKQIKSSMLDDEVIRAFLKEGRK